MDKANWTNLLREVREDKTALQRRLEVLNDLEAYLNGKIQEPQNHRGPQSEGELTQGEAAERVLRAHGKPMSTNAIIDEMIAKGYYAEKGDRKQLVNSVYSALRRRKQRFRLVSKGTWGLVEWD